MTWPRCRAGDLFGELTGFAGLRSLQSETLLESIAHDGPLSALELRSLWRKMFG